MKRHLWPTSRISPSGNDLNDKLSYEEWVDVYKKLVFWELELEKLDDPQMHEILTMQKSEANTQFSKFIEENYLDWVNGQGYKLPYYQTNS